MHTFANKLPTLGSLIVAHNLIGRLCVAGEPLVNESYAAVKPSNVTTVGANFQYAAAS